MYYNCNMRVYLKIIKYIKKTKMKTTLESICSKFCEINHNEENYEIGGGLSNGKFASRRHEDARNDGGKLTLGEATQLFKKATGLSVEEVRAVFEYAVPNMEWHHAGLLPKAYGGGMKKTYFLNSDEICSCAKNWKDNVEKLNLSNAAAKAAAENKKSFEERKLEFLQNNAKKIERVSTRPEHFYEIEREMNGKFGWFNSEGKSYKLPEYYSGWEFESAEKRTEFFTIK